MVRRIVNAMLVCLGICWFWRWRNRYKVTVLFVHGVMPTSEGQGTQPTRSQLDPAVLDTYLKTLVKYYEFISPEEAAEIVAGKRQPRKYLAVFTIDDGYENAKTQAWPVLKSNGVPAAIFVTSEQLTTQDLFWWDRLDYALLHANTDMRSVRVGDDIIPVDLSCREAIQKSSRQIIFRSRESFLVEAERISALHELIEKLENSELLADLESWVGVLRPDQLLALSNDGASIGSHSRNHVRLAYCDDQYVSEEVTESKKIIESVVGQECSMFCYPEGSIDSRVEESVRDAGYQCAFTTERGTNDVGDNVFRLKRIHLPNSASKSELLAMVSGMSQYMSDRKSQYFARH